MKNLTIFIALFALIIYSAGCKKDKNDCIDGNGDLKQETRNVGDFKKIIANGAYNISFSQTNNAQVDLFGDSNILPIISTTVSNQSDLTIETLDDNCYSTQNTIEITATSPHFEGVTLNGAGKVEAHNLTTDQLHYEINGDATISSSFTSNDFSVIVNGSSDAQFTGTALNGILNISGAGNIHASTLLLNSCTITIEGTGNVHVHVNTTLTVVISGSGNVYYTGNPDINSTITGTGQVIKVD